LLHEHRFGKVDSTDHNLLPCGWTPDGRLAVMSVPQRGLGFWTDAESDPVYVQPAYGADPIYRRFAIHGPWLLCASHPGGVRLLPWEPLLGD
jgi:hypothetical protein